MQNFLFNAMGEPCAGPIRYLDGNPINRALALLRVPTLRRNGLVARLLGREDEFDQVGLYGFRTNDDWAAASELGEWWALDEPPPGRKILEIQNGEETRGSRWITEECATENLSEWAASWPDARERPRSPRCANI